MTLVARRGAPAGGPPGRGRRAAHRGWLREPGVDLRLGAEPARLDAGSRRAGRRPRARGRRRRPRRRACARTRRSPRSPGSRSTDGAVAADAHHAHLRPGRPRRGRRRARRTRRRAAAACTSSTGARRSPRARSPGASPPARTRRWDGARASGRRSATHTLKLRGLGRRLRRGVGSRPTSDGAFTVWYRARRAARVGVLTHERDEDYERGRERSSGGGADVRPAAGSALRACVVVPARDEEELDRRLPARARRPARRRPRRLRGAARARPLHRRDRGARAAARPRATRPAPARRSHGRGAGVGARAPARHGPRRARLLAVGRRTG